MAGLVVVGAGPGIGQSVSLRFAREGMPVTLIARSATTLQPTHRALEPTGVPLLTVQADSTTAHELRTALDLSVAHHGPPDAVLYNAAWIRRDRLGELSVDDHFAAWSVNVLGAITTASHVIPMMSANGGGSFMVTGGMPQPDPDFVSLSLGKAGVRALVAMLGAEHRRDGIHVATVTVGGPVAPGGAFDPDDIAHHYWRLHGEAPDQWTLEVIHDGHDREGRGWAGRPPAEPARP
jgi:NAD(P)-dependent dehydrogenase (short-subunit alcohol dehydrogenase family)